MTSNSQNDLVFYCPLHQLRFHGSGEVEVQCEQGGHPVGSGFPDKSCWEYCCDCATFWPLEQRSGKARRADCLVCERPTAKRYVCEKCLVVSIESTALVRRRAYSIDDTGGIKPDCPGCSAQTGEIVFEHNCPEAEFSFTTARSVCPFCDESIHGTGSDTKAGTAAMQHRERGASSDHEDGAALLGESEITARATEFAYGSAQVEDSHDSIHEIPPTHINEEPVPHAARELDQPAYTPMWAPALAQAPPKRVVPWIPAALAVAVTFGVVITIAIILSGMRAQPKPSPTILQPNPLPGMVYVQGGEFTMGNDTGDEYERPAHKATVKPFFMDIYEVTCGEYQKFAAATGHKVPPAWANGQFPNGAAKQPVAGVNWYDAIDYAKWAKKRLPTEEEWEFAARGTDGRLYPWGNEWRANAANAGDSSAGQLTNVGSYPDGKSPFGVMDMIGNAWEWTSSELKPYPGSAPSHPAGAERKIIRGASWFKDNPPDWTVTYRGFASPSGGKDYSKVGFRCAKDVVNP